MEINSISKKNMEAEAINMLPISTRKLASLFHRILKEGFV
jgi:hypothetical protein